MAKLNLNKIGLILGLVGAFFFTVRYILFLLFPGFMSSFFTLITNNMIPIASRFIPSFSGFLLGLLYSFIAAYVIGAIFAIIYNLANKK